MDDQKRILIFSDAGGTGRSYHAELSARNQRLRVHYLLEPGWKADAAIQGLGRTNRTNQAQPPLFRPIATDVKAEKRFLSTIARRLDTLGAITRGQRQTGGQGLFRPEDNLEPLCPRCAAPALSPAGARQGRGLLARTLRVRHRPEADGRQRHQGRAAADHHLPQSPAGADHRACRASCSRPSSSCSTPRSRAPSPSGTYDVGLETLTAESFIVTDRRRSRVMNDYRVELIGFTEAMAPRLKALGLVSEIISWKLRLFIPTSAGGLAILASLLERHTLVGVTDRMAAA
jgi:hypothetical protein